MPELFHVDGVAKVRVFGREATLDGLRAPAGTLVGRIAPDEVVFVGSPGTAAALVEDLEGQVAGEGIAALVIDHTDGWTFYSLTGEGLEEVLGARVRGAAARRVRGRRPSSRSARSATSRRRSSSGRAASTS